MALQSSSCVAIQHVAVATDFSQCSEHAVEHALAVARHFGATLYFLHLVRPSKFAFVPEMLAAVDEVAERDCEQLIARLERNHRLEGIQCRRCVEQGEIPEIASQFVRDEKIDLLVVGTHGRGGVSRLLLGSSAQQIFHYVRCPVLTVGPASPGAGQRLELKRVLFSTDLSHESLAAIPYVLTAVEEWHAALDVLHVCSSGDPRHQELMAGLRERFDCLLAGTDAAPVRCRVLAGKPAPAVLKFADAEKVNLIVLGLKPQRALYDGPLWSHAYEIVRHAHCPVLSVRAGQS